MKNEGYYGRVAMVARGKDTLSKFGQKVVTFLVVKVCRIGSSQKVRRTKMKNAGNFVHGYTGASQAQDIQSLRMLHNAHACPMISAHFEFRCDGQLIEFYAEQSQKWHASSVTPADRCSHIRGLFK